ncbi:MAG: PAS domain-containing protein [Thiobacillus sp.]|nr:PAS domain-containing protein [Thiobacillus sp.]
MNKHVHPFIIPAKPDVQAEPVSIVLSDDGLIHECNSVCESLFGYPQEELLGQHISLLFPNLESVPLVRSSEVNPRLKYLSHCAIPFLSIQRNGKRFASELFFNYLNNHNGRLRLIARKIENVKTDFLANSQPLLQAC